jgi:prolyl-tRNA synthetase
MGDGLLKFKNRNGHDFCLGATHEEVITDYVRHDIKSYRDLPVTLYQVQTKFRDEVRPRFGLMRGREFIMKDAYSFDADGTGAIASYERLYEAYKAIFDRVGLDYRIVEADAGNIGGSRTHEFQVLADAGEDHLMVCGQCEFAANIEVAPARRSADLSFVLAEPLPVERFATPGLRSIADLSQNTGVPEAQLVKTMFFSAAQEGSGDFKPVAVLLCGDDEVNPIKLKNVLGLANPPMLLSDLEVRRVTGASPGSCGPLNLSIPIYMDQGVKKLSNFIVGANIDDFHLKNVNYGRDFPVQAIVDVRMAQEGDLCPLCGGQYTSIRGIEVGHVFYLGTKYSKAMNATFLDSNGKPKLSEMGCYGIGISRTVQAAVEQSHDKDGIVWPISIAPFQVHICLLDPDVNEVFDYAEELYSNLVKQGIEVFVDDRKERPGIKFKDADLIGLPLRVNIGKRGLEAGKIEMVERRTREMLEIPKGEGLLRVSSWVRESMGETIGTN